MTCMPQRYCRFLIAVSLLLLPGGVTGQDRPAGEAPPLPADVSTLDGIIRAYYEVVSGPAGQPRQVARDHSLHHPDALVAITGLNASGEPTIRTMTLAEYHEGSSEPAEGFYEQEIHRQVQSFGSVTHVWSTYEWRREPSGPVRGRGINSIQLYFDGDRWWITSWIFDSERPDNPIPPEYSAR